MKPAPPVTTTRLLVSNDPVILGALSFCEADLFANYVGRSPAHFVQRAPKIFANHPEHEYLDASYEQQYHHERSPAGHFGTDGKLADDDIDRVHQAQCGARQSYRRH